MKRRHLLLLAMTLAVGTSCDDGILAAGLERQVFVRPPAVLVIQNASKDEALWSFVMSAAAAPLIDWVPGVEVGGPGYIAPGEERTLLPAEINGASVGDEVIVYTWRAVPGVGDGIQPGAMRVQTLRLLPLLQ